MHGVLDDRGRRHAEGPWPIPVRELPVGHAQVRMADGLHVTLEFCCRGVSGSIGDWWDSPSWSPWGRRGRQPSLISRWCRGSCSPRSACSLGGASSAAQQTPGAPEYSAGAGPAPSSSRGSSSPAPSSHTDCCSAEPGATAVATSPGSPYSTS